MYCAQCGKSNDAAGRFCSSCGRVLTPDGSLPSADQAAPATASQFSLEAAFVGPNARYYQAKWQAINSARNSRSWNTAACFFIFIWLAYRKMYGLACLFSLIMLATTLAEIAFKLTGGPIDLVVNLACALVCGFWGNSWHQKHAGGKIGKLAKNGHPSGNLFRQLKKVGGTNLAASLGFVLFLVLVAVISILYFGSPLLEMMWRISGQLRL